MRSSVCFYMPLFGFYYYQRWIDWNERGKNENGHTHTHTPFEWMPICVVIFAYMYAIGFATHLFILFVCRIIFFYLFVSVFMLPYLLESSNTKKITRLILNHLLIIGCNIRFVLWMESIIYIKMFLRKI